MLPQSRPYLSYLVRLWGETSQGRMVWRAALESVQSGEQQHFASVEGLFAFIGANLQTEEKTVAVVITAIIQTGRVDELLILWRTSVAPALKTMLGLIQVSLLVDWAKHALLIVAIYPIHHSSNVDSVGDYWQTTLTPLADLLHPNSIRHAVYTVINAAESTQ